MGSARDRRGWSSVAVSLWRYPHRNRNPTTRLRNIIITTGMHPRLGDIVIPFLYIAVTRSLCAASSLEKSRQRDPPWRGGPRLCGLGRFHRRPCRRQPVIGTLLRRISRPPSLSSRVPPSRTRYASRSERTWDKLLRFLSPRSVSGVGTCNLWWM